MIRLAGCGWSANRRRRRRRSTRKFQSVYIAAARLAARQKKVQRCPTATRRTARSAALFDRQMRPSSIVAGDLYPPRERGKIVGDIAATWAIASIAGPALGGLITDHLTWPVIFWLNLRLAAFAIAMTNTALKRLPWNKRPQVGCDRLLSGRACDGCTSMRSATTAISRAEPSSAASRRSICIRRSAMARLSPPASAVTINSRAIPVPVPETTWARAFNCSMSRAASRSVNGRVVQMQRRWSPAWA